MELKIISEVSPRKETKSKILIFIPVSESKNLIMVGNNFISLKLDASEYMYIKLMFTKFLFSSEDQFITIIFII